MLGLYRFVMFFLSMPSRAREQLVRAWSASPFHHREQPRRSIKIDLRSRPYTPRTVTGAAEQSALKNQTGEVRVLLSTALDPDKVEILGNQLRAEAESSDVVAFEEMGFPGDGEADIRYSLRQTP